MRVGFWVIALVTVVLVLAAGPAAAEIRRIEEIGTVPIRSADKGSANARDAALQAALREAVRRVAQSFLMDAENAGPESGNDTDELEKVLGKRMVPYTTRFRVLEDRGERPAMFVEKGVKTEYVVVVEVFVDADRVEQRLIDAGLLARDPLDGEVTRIDLELQGVKAYGAVMAVRELLTERVGVRSAVPRSFERGTAVLEVELAGADRDPVQLTEQLAALGPPELLIRVLSVDAMRAVVDVTWRPAANDGESRPAGSR